MEKVAFRFDVLNQLDELVFILFNEDYFSYSENAKSYVDKIIDFTIKSIESFSVKITPSKLVHLGEKYIFYKANSRTTWYIFFESNENKFLVTGIINNHCQEAKWLT